MSATISHDANDAIDALNSGEIVAIPTETVYGLAARLDFPSAVRRVFDVKGRPHDHPLIVHECSIERARRWGEFNEAALALAKKYWPGPMTLLLRRTPNVPDSVTGGRDTVAIRIPSHPTALKIIESVDCGVVAPSANRFGKVSPTTAQHVLDDIGDDITLIIDGGECSVGVESTIIDCTTSIPQVLRPGAVATDDVEDTIGMKSAPAMGPSRASGMLASHYAPRCVVELCETAKEAENLRQRLVDHGNHVLIIDRTHDLDEYARHLYGDLRNADAQGCDVVIAVLPPRTGVGEAICDRLTKAAFR